MEYRILNNGVKMPMLGFGVYQMFITHLKLHQSRTKVSAVTEKNFHQSRKRHVQQIDWLSLGRSLTPQRKARKGNARHADHSEYTKQKSQRRDPLPNRGA